MSCRCTLIAIFEETQACARQTEKSSRPLETRAMSDSNGLLDLLFEFVM